MDRRLQLHEVLCNVLGSRNVYFQPPPNIQMQYPAIVYQRSVVSTEFADDNPYMRRKRYQVTHISRDPDDPTPDKIGALPMCVHSTFFTSENLNHDIFFIYF